MKVIVDTREQMPLPFATGGIISEVRHEALDIADYACEFEDGYQPHIYFERKSLGDLFGTMTNGYDRFKREYERFEAIPDEKKEFWLYMESSLFDVRNGYSHSQFPGESMVKKLFTLWERYNIHLLFMPNRREAMEFMTQRWIARGKACADEKRIKK